MVLCSPWVFWSRLPAFLLPYAKSLNRAQILVGLHMYHLVRSVLALLCAPDGNRWFTVHQKVVPCVSRSLFLFLSLFMFLAPQPPIYLLLHVPLTLFYSCRLSRQSIKLVRHHIGTLLCGYLYVLSLATLLATPRTKFAAPSFPGSRVSSAPGRDVRASTFRFLQAADDSIISMGMCPRFSYLRLLQ